MVINRNLLIMLGGKDIFYLLYLGRKVKKWLCNTLVFRHIWADVWVY